MEFPANRRVTQLRDREDPYIIERPRIAVGSMSEEEIVVQYLLHHNCRLYLFAFVGALPAFGSSFPEGTTAIE
jgi:hypothetical protein